MDFTPPQISIEVVIHTNVPLYFHLLSHVCEVLLFKNGWKRDNALHQWLEKKHAFFFSWEEQKKRRWSVIKVDYFFFLSLKNTLRTWSYKCRIIENMKVFICVSQWVMLY